MLNLKLQGQLNILFFVCLFVFIHLQHNLDSKILNHSITGKLSCWKGLWFFWPVSGTMTTLIAVCTKGCLTTMFDKQKWIKNLPPQNCIFFSSKISHLKTQRKTGIGKDQRKVNQTQLWWSCDGSEPHAVDFLFGPTPSKGDWVAASDQWWHSEDKTTWNYFGKKTGSSDALNRR